MNVTFKRSVAAGADDGYIIGTTFYGSGNTVYIGSNNTNKYNAFFRFTNITVPKNATVTSATLNLVPVEDLSGKTCNVKIYLCDEDNAAAPTNATTYNAKPLTTGVADGDIRVWTNGGTTYTTDNFSGDLQVVINRAGWVSGNAVCIMVKDDSSSSIAYRGAGSRNLSAETAAYLTITYTAPVVGNKYPLPAFRVV